MNWYKKKRDKETSDYNQKELSQGKEEEKEHTGNEEIAEEITKDHLDEIPNYYTELKKMEDKIKK